jgi:branched-chain amino acid transport system substrate-binding protein
MSEQSESGKKGPSILPRLVAMLVIGIVVGAALGYLVESPAVAAERSRADALATQVADLQNQVTQLQATKVYTIGASFPITGELAAIGTQFQAAAQMAIDDLNNETAGLNIRFTIVIQDDKTTDEGALSAVQTLAQAGVKVILGPAASSQVKACKSYADDNNIVLISPSSTSPTLAIPDDYIFRTTGSDAGQSKALARLAHDQGAKKVVVFARDDEYGVAFGEFFKNAFEALNGTASIMHYASGQSDYASEVAQLSAKVASEKDDAVVIITFDTDGANILSHAKDDATLQSVRWFSAEGIHGTPQLTDAPIANFIQKVKLYGTRPVFKENPLYATFSARLKARTGVDPGVFTEKVYDSVFLAGWSIIEGSYDGVAIKTNLPKVAQNFYGASGWCILDENGDRLMQDYAIWTVSPTVGGFAYQDVGSYSGGSITWG